MGALKGPHASCHRRAPGPPMNVRMTMIVIVIENVVEIMFGIMIMVIISMMVETLIGILSQITIMTMLMSKSLMVVTMLMTESMMIMMRV